MTNNQMPLTSGTDKPLSILYVTTALIAGREGRR